MTGYEIIEQLGESERFFKVLKLETGENFAMKIIETTDLKAVTQIKAEADILKRLDCEFIIKCHELLED